MSVSEGGSFAGVELGRVADEIFGLVELDSVVVEAGAEVLHCQGVNL